MKKILCLLSIIVTVFVAQAQERPMNGQSRPAMRNRQGMERQLPQRQMTKEQRERLELFSIQFITKKLNLTPAEAEKFWPLYNEQKEASRNLMQTAKEDEIAFQESMLMIRKKFKKDLMPILKTEERVNLALKVDRELLNKMRNEILRRKRPM
jgi:membrane-associated HD superfamily phosphohydrolase